VSLELAKDPRHQRSAASQIPWIRKILAALNLPLVAVLTALTVLGLLIVASAITGRNDYSMSRQILGVVLGGLALLAFWIVDYRLWSRLTLPLYIVCLLLILTPLIPGLGVEVNGAKNWIMIFGQQIQPGEFAKVLVIILMAALVSRYRGKLQSGKEYLKCLGLLALPVICVALQPDLGTGLVYLAIGLVVLFAGGANRWWLALTVILGATLIVGVLALDPVLDQYFGHDVLIKTYQYNRLMVFLNQDLDPSGLGFNLQQAKIAIGSGGWLGAGYMQGAQAGLGFLPEAPTDFIFCVLAEDFGFVGSLGLIGLYALLIFLSIRIALKAEAFGALLIAGGVGMWIFQILVNIGMTCGLMPITGIPLPFMSYGSSFMIVNFSVVGLICSISTRTAWESQAQAGLEPLS